MKMKVSLRKFSLPCITLMFKGGPAPIVHKLPKDSRGGDPPKASPSYETVHPDAKTKDVTRKAQIHLSGENSVKPSKLNPPTVCRSHMSHGSGQAGLV